MGTEKDDEIARLNAVIALVGSTAQGLSIIAGDPALGYRGVALQSILNLIGAAASRGGDSVELLADLSAQVDDMVAMQREPTKDEWASLRQRSDFAHAILNPEITKEE